MAISLKATQGWFSSTVVGPVSVTLPAGGAAGDRYYVWAMWKPFSSVATLTAGWTKLVEFADGSVAQGVGIGSMKIACWYRNWVSGITAPTITWSSAPNPGVFLHHLWTPGVGATFDTPTVVTAAWPSQISGTVNASSAVSVQNSSVVMCGMGFPASTATMTRPTNAIDASPAVTWTGNYVEAPASHATTTSGNDAAADTGHRFVTTGNASTTLSASTTLAAAKTGSALWVVQGLVGIGPPSDVNTQQFFAMF